MAALLWGGSVLYFPTLHLRHDPGRNLFSELGAVGAPGGPLFNLLGFLIPGALVIVLALALNALAGGPRRSPVGPALLASGGLAFIMAGLFAPDMRQLGSVITLGHVFLIQASSVAFAAAMIPLGARLRADPRFAWLGALSPLFILFFVAEIGWQVVWRASGAVEPGWGQRIGFFGWFLWVAIAGALAARPAADRAPEDQLHS